MPSLTGTHSRNISLNRPGGPWGLEISEGARLITDFCGSRTSSRPFYYLNGTVYSSASSIPGWSTERAGYNLITNGNVTGASGSTLPSGWNVDQPFGGIAPSNWTTTTLSATQGATFRINGTTTISNRLLISPCSTRISVVPGLTYTLSWSAAITAGSYPYSLTPSFLFHNSAGTNIGNTSGNTFTLSETLTRFTSSVTIPASTSTINIRFDFTGYSTPGTVVDFTIFIGGVQLEPGPISLSYQPTSGSAVTSGSNINYADGLIDATTTNYLRPSQSFSDSPWVAPAGATLVGGQPNAPDGSSTAGLFTPGSSGLTPDHTNTNANRFFIEPSISAPTTYTSSIWVRSAGINGPVTIYVLDKQTDAVRGSTTVTSSSSWQRISATGTVSAGASGARFLVASSHPIHVWGAQLEQGSTMGNYIPTGASIASGPSGGPRVNGLIPFGAHQPRITERGLLVEETKTNLISRSEEFNTSDWGYSGSTAITSNQATAPNGTLTADFIVNTINVGSFLYFTGTNTLANSTTYVKSIYVKQCGSNPVFVSTCDKGAGEVATLFNLSTLAVTGVDASTSYMTQLGNGWFRIVHSFTTNSTGTPYMGVYYIGAYGASSSVAAFYIWGNQLEVGTNPSSYIPTYNTSMTRASDSVNITGLSSILGNFRTNLVVRTQEMQTTPWNILNSASAVNNTSTAPDSTNTACTVTFPANPLSSIYQPISTVDGLTCTVSVWARSTISKTFKFRAYGSPQTTSQDFTTTSTWTRYTWTSVMPSGTGNIGIENGSSGVAGSAEFWGFQVELGSSATDYIAAGANLASSGNPVSVLGWAEYTSSQGATDSTLVGINDGSYRHLMALRRRSGNVFGANSRFQNEWNTDPSAPNGKAGIRILKGVARMRNNLLGNAVDGIYYSHSYIRACGPFNTVSFGDSSPGAAARLNGYIQRVIIMGDISDTLMQKLSLLDK